jgi:hypothetical protein
MLTVFTISTIVLAISIVFLFIKNNSLKNRISFLKDHLELAEAERDLQKYAYEFLKKQTAETPKPTPAPKKKYYRKPKAKKTGE